MKMYEILTSDPRELGSVQKKFYFGPGPCVITLLEEQKRNGVIR
jgi:hypothetical protein